MYILASAELPALLWLSRSWAQYRQDRGITLGAQLIGAECTAECNAVGCHN